MTSGGVVVVMNRFQGYEDLIPAMLRDMGRRAGWVDARPGNSFPVKLLLRLGVLQRIGPLARQNTDRIITAAQGMAPDTLLIIGPENLGGAEIARLKAGLPGVRVVLYIWDSAANRHLDQAMIDAADAAFSFDPADSRSFANLTHLPLFHTLNAPDDQPASPKTHDLWFVGTTRLRRVLALARIERKARARGQTCFFHLSAPSTAQLAVYRVLGAALGFRGEISRHGLTRERYQATLRQSACVIDVEQRNQTGLTMRTMEAVFAGRALATSNHAITESELFRHFPITVFSPDDPEINIPKPRHTAMSTELFHRYHARSWLAALLKA